MGWYDPYKLGRGNRQLRKMRELADRTPEQFQRDHDVRELRKKRRRELLRRLIGRG